MDQSLNRGVVMSDDEEDQEYHPKLSLLEEEYMAKAMIR